MGFVNMSDKNVVKMAKMIKMVVWYGKIYFGVGIQFISDSKSVEGCRNQIGFACAGSNPAVRDFMADVPEWLRGLTRTYFYSQIGKLKEKGLQVLMR